MLSFFARSNQWRCESCNVSAAGLAGGYALGSIAQYALAAAPTPIRMIGIGTAMIGGTLGTVYGFDKARAALTD